MMMQCEGLATCDKHAGELIVNSNDLSQYKLLCPEHRNQWLYKAGWYRASESVKQVVLMNQAKDMPTD